MIKSYIAKSTINFVDFEFYIRPGDLLVHDTANHNRMTVYRNGQIVKVVKQGSLGIVALLKNNFIEEVVAPPAVPVTPPATKPRQSQSDATVSPVEPTKTFSKKDKAIPREVLISDNPRLMEALSKEPKEELFGNNPSSSTTEKITIEK